MTLHQLHAIKLWHVDHKLDCPVEYHTWDSVLTAWLFGCMAEPAALILSWHGMAVGCVLLFLTPTLYVCLRRALHRQGVLRCDWLAALDVPR